MVITLAATSGKGFWKTVDGVDRSQKGGWCLDGEFVDGGKETELADGTVLVRKWAERKNTCCAVYRVDSTSTGDVYGRNAGLVQVGETYDWDSQMLSFLNHVESVVSDNDPRAVAIEQIRALMAEHGIKATEL